jgi:sirohydrochlorin ferrochelatase
MSDATILLLDNGTRRPEATLNLRRLARSLSEASGLTVHPVSLQHADKIAPAALDGKAAQTFTPFLARRLDRADRRFVVLPLFFGPSRALSSYIPEQVAELSARYGQFELRLSPVLCPLPEGEPRLAEILCDLLPGVAAHERRRIVLVDHGSPIPQVTAVRRYLAGEMRRLLGPDIELREAVMERREGAGYDFNGELLARILDQAGAQDARTPLALSLLFLSPGSHAGPGGDIEAICRQARERHPGWPIRLSGLVGEHPGLLPILSDRLRTGLELLS